MSYRRSDEDRTPETLVLIFLALILAAVLGLLAGLAIAINRALRRHGEEPIFQCSALGSVVIVALGLLVRIAGSSGAAGLWLLGIGGVSFACTVLLANVVPNEETCEMDELDEPDGLFSLLADWWSSDGLE